jgi:hypothetical protein
MNTCKENDRAGQPASNEKSHDDGRGGKLQQPKRPARQPRVALNDDEKSAFNKYKFWLLAKVHGDRRLSRSDLQVAYFIINGLNDKHGYAWPGENGLAEATGLHRRTVRRVVDRLVDQFNILVYVGERGPGRPTWYLPHPDTCPEENGARVCAIYSRIEEALSAIQGNAQMAQPRTLKWRTGVRHETLPNVRHETLPNL